jgi:hypothetical protein
VKIKVDIVISNESNDRTFLEMIVNVRKVEYDSRVIMNRDTEKNPFFDIYFGTDFEKEIVKEWLKHEAYRFENLSKNTTVKQMTIYERVKIKSTNLKILKKGVKLALEDIRIRDERVYYKSRLFISESDHLKLHLLRKHHDSSMQNHSEYRHMHAKLLKNYYWDKIKDDCRRYATNCFICRRAKTYNISKQSLLTSLSISQRKWMNFFFDFVTKLSKYRKRNQIFQNIFVIVNRLTKRKLYESMTNIETQNLFDVFKGRVFCCYDLSISLMSDRDELSRDVATHILKGAGVVY